jgi:hypothetical protein
MGQRLGDARDHVAVTLMGWVARLATKQYRSELANYIQVGMHVYESAEGPAYGEEKLQDEYDVLTQEEVWATHENALGSRWVSLS